MELLEQPNLFNQSFYNTIEAKDAELANCESKAKFQEQFILSVLKKDVEYSPYDVMELCERLGNRIKESSVRRALTNLRTNMDAKIEYTGNRVVNLKYSKVPNQTIRLI